MVGAGVGVPGVSVGDCDVGATVVGTADGTAVVGTDVGTAVLGVLVGVTVGIAEGIAVVGVDVGVPGVSVGEGVVVATVVLIPPSPLSSSIVLSSCAHTLATSTRHANRSVLLHVIM